MYRTPVAACTSLPELAPNGVSPEVSRAANQNLATTPPGLLQRELQGCSEVAFLGQLRVTEASRMRRMARREPRSRPGSRLSGLGGPVGPSEATTNSSRWTGGEVHAAGGARTAGGSDPVGARASARRFARISSTRFSMFPAAIARAGQPPKSRPARTRDPGTRVGAFLLTRDRRASRQTLRMVQTRVHASR